MDCLDKIKALNKITISRICRELKINRSNLINGRSTRDNEKKVYEAIISRYEDIIKK